MFNRDLFNKNLVCVSRFDNGDLYFVVIDLKGKVYKKIKCEDEQIYNYFIEVFNL